MGKIQEQQIDVATGETTVMVEGGHQMLEGFQKFENIEKGLMNEGKEFRRSQICETLLASRRALKDGRKEI